jgi:hypothetical protein
MTISAATWQRELARLPGTHHGLRPCPGRGRGPKPGRSPSSAGAQGAAVLGGACGHREHQPAGITGGRSSCKGGPQHRRVVWQLKVVQAARGLLAVGARRSEHAAWVPVPSWPAQLAAAAGARRLSNANAVEIDAELALRPFGSPGTFLATVFAAPDRSWMAGRAGGAPVPALQVGGGDA